jgi:hypothetical protein
MTTKQDIKRLRRLADKVLEPILKDRGYEVVLPDDPSRSTNIMKSVMERIDTADILVADLTGDNANVYYELAVRHSLGLPYVLVSEHKPRFDIATLAYIKYKPGRPQDECDKMEAWLTLADEAAKASRVVDNPISDFYKRPLAEVSPASGLALGYFRNFLRFAVVDIHKAADSVELQEIVADGHADANREVWSPLPKTLSEAFHNAIDKHFVYRGLLQRARIKKDPREFHLYALPQAKPTDSVVFIDIPTAMNALQVAVDGRTPAGVDADSPIWMRLERQEINRFRSAVRREMVKPENKVATEDITLIWGLPNP